MDPGPTTNEPSAVRGVTTFIMGTIAFLTCPCHLPILLLLLSGTAAGAALAAHTGTALLILLAVFASSAYATWRLLDNGEQDTGHESGQIPRHPQRD
jgi:mercuric ion transport protein